MNVIENIQNLIQESENQNIVFIKGNIDQLKELNLFYNQVISVI